MPRLWSATVDEHRREVREAVVDATASLVAERGLTSVTMSGIAERSGIGRATLYKYFPDVDSILLAWHERQVTAHAEHLAEVSSRCGYAIERLEAVLRAYALVAREDHGSDVAMVLHRGEHVARAHHRLRGIVRDLIAEAVSDGDVREDVVPEELTTYCLHALTAAATLPSKAAVARLVEVTLSALRTR